MPHYDLVVIGTGSGNSIVDHDFADWNVAIVEHAKFGGTCLNAGCIPTKMFVLPADLAASPSEAARLGVDLTLDQVRWPDIRDRIFGRIDPIEDGGRRYRKHNTNVTVYERTARFTGTRQLLIGDETVTADAIVLAAGSRPALPDIAGLAGTVDVPDSGHHTSDTVMRIDAPPPRMAILGGGYVAAEMAHVFGSFGTDVTVITRGEAMLRGEDPDVSARFTELARQRWDLRTGRQVTRAQRERGVTALELTDGSTVHAELVLVAIGRRPNSDVLDAERGGLALLPDGRIEVDSSQRTSVPGVWALGDICSADQLKHVANHQARLVRHNLLHPDTPARDDRRAVAHAVFSAPQIAAVGLTESQASEQGLRYVAATRSYGGVAYGWALEDTTGFCKVLADPDTGQILGAHIIGPQASSLLQPLIQAMAFGQHPYQVARGQYWIHPSLPEVVENALLDLDLVPPADGWPTNYLL